MEVAFAVAVVAALVDWYAVARSRRGVEVVAKPGALVALALAAALLEPADGGQRALFVAALVLSLAGDVVLLLDQRWFVAGLAAFLMAHIAYLAGFVAGGVDPGALLIGAAVTGIAAVVIGRRIVAAAPERLRAPVAVYITVISAMVATALGTRDALAVAGAASFYVSDALIGWTRFVSDVRHGRLTVMVTYHVGQALLVLSLLPR